METIAIAAPAAAVFRVYAAVERWPAWDPEVVAVHLPQGLVPGATGWLKPRKGPRASIAVTAVEPARSFTVTSALPLCTMVFEHVLTERDGVTIAEHRVRFEGVSAFLFRRLVGRQIEAALPRTMAGLKAAVEGGAPSPHPGVA